MRRISIALVILSGCVGLDPEVIHKAAFDTRCPEERIRVERLAHDLRTVDLLVCGKEKRYQDVAPHGPNAMSNPPVWVDVTPPPPTE